MPAEFTYLYICCIYIYIYTYNNKKIYVIFVITAREDLIKLKPDYMYYLI